LLSLFLLFIPIIFYYRKINFATKIPPEKKITALVCRYFFLDLETNAHRRFVL